MKKLTVRNIILKFIIAFQLLILISLISCDKSEEEHNGNPTIEFITDNGYTYLDTTIAQLKTIKVGINAKYNGTDKLTKFYAKKNGDLFIDPPLGIYANEYSWDIDITKGSEEKESWEFTIGDETGNYSSIYLDVFKKDTVIDYGEIDEYLNVQLGAQNNSSVGGFFSLSTGNVYTLEEGYNNQELINLVYYYDNYTDKLEESIVASPGANIEDVIFTGEYALLDWQVRNSTRFSRSQPDISSVEFDNAQNDSILIANTFYYPNGGRKTKFLESGDIYIFVLEDNRTGMFKVVSTSGTTSGDIIIDIKVQKQ